MENLQHQEILELMKRLADETSSDNTLKTDIQNKIDEVKPEAPK